MSCASGSYGEHRHTSGIKNGQKNTLEALGRRVVFTLPSLTHAVFHDVYMFHLLTALAFLWNKTGPRWSPTLHEHTHQGLACDYFLGRQARWEGTPPVKVSWVEH